MIRKLTAVLTALFIAVTLFGCDPGSRSGGRRLRIVTTIFPIYDWTRSVLGSNPADAELVVLEDSGVDLHSFQPTVDDVAMIASCDVFIYVGGESDGWVSKALSGLKNSGRTEISLLEVLGERAALEERVEGMEAEDGSGEGSGPEGDEEREADEHVWLSLRNAEIFCEYIAGVIAEKDPAHREEYGSNAKAYVSELKALDDEFKRAAGLIDNKVLLFADRFPFRYFTDDYGFDYYAAFPGCSAETEASFGTVVFLAEKVNELSLDVIFRTEGSDGSIAETVKKTSRKDWLKICVLDSLQSVSAAGIKDGATYLGLMRGNLDSLKEAFGVAE